MIISREGWCDIKRWNEKTVWFQPLATAVGLGQGKLADVDAPLPNGVSLGQPSYWMSATGWCVCSYPCLLVGSKKVSPVGVDLGLRPWVRVDPSPACGSIPCVWIL